MIYIMLSKAKDVILAKTNTAADDEIAVKYGFRFWRNERDSYPLLGRYFPDYGVAYELFEPRLNLYRAVDLEKVYDLLLVDGATLHGVRLKTPNKGVAIEESAARYMVGKYKRGTKDKWEEAALLFLLSYVSGDKTLNRQIQSMSERMFAEQRSIYKSQPKIEENQCPFPKRNCILCDKALTCFCSKKRSFCTVSVDSNGGIVYAVKE